MAAVASIVHHHCVDVRVWYHGAVYLGSISPGQALAVMVALPVKDI